MSGIQLAHVATAKGALRSMNNSLMSTLKLKMMWFSFGVVVGLTALSVAFGGVPDSKQSRIEIKPYKLKNDPAIYQELSEIDIKKEESLNFDSGIESLSKQENKFQKQEKRELISLSNHPRLKSVMKRIESKPYASKSPSSKGSRKKLN
jgi:hypothetical protein